MKKVVLISAVLLSSYSGLSAANCSTPQSFNGQIISLCPGPQGEVGPQGPIGPAGPIGNTGLQGPQGDPGIKGDTGAIGPQGIPGTNGKDGVDGQPGAKGDKGDKGDRGAPGAPAVVNYAPLYRGIASAGAISQITVDQNKDFSVGLGVATYRGYSDVALGVAARINQSLLVRGGISTSGLVAGSLNYSW